MDKNTIVESGMLEQYLLGELSESQQLEVEKVLDSDAALKSYFDALEANFESIGMENAVQAPVISKERLLKSISAETIQPGKSEPDSNMKTINYYLAIAASIAAVMLVGAIWMYLQWQNAEDQLQMAENENTELLEELKALQLTLEETNKWYAAINSTDVQRYLLKGNDLSPTTKVISYVNNEAKSVVLNVSGLPELDADHDYQLWADVEGQMVNMGVITKNESMLAMSYIENAESLNITIEPAGGSEQPTVSQLVANVYLTSL